MFLCIPMPDFLVTVHFIQFQYLVYSISASSYNSEVALKYVNINVTLIKKPFATNMTRWLILD